MILCSFPFFSFICRCLSIFFQFSFLFVGHCPILRLPFVVLVAGRDSMEHWAHIFYKVKPIQPSVFIVFSNVFNVKKTIMNDYYYYYWNKRDLFCWCWNRAKEKRTGKKWHFSDPKSIGSLSFSVRLITTNDHKIYYLTRCCQEMKYNFSCFRCSFLSPNLTSKIYWIKDWIELNWSVWVCVCVCEFA